jgi:hypothetical protein
MLKVKQRLYYSKAAPVYNMTGVALYSSTQYGCLCPHDALTLETKMSLDKILTNIIFMENVIS